MQITSARVLTLIAVFAAGAVALYAMADDAPPATGRYPREDWTFIVPEWAMSAPKVEHSYGVDLITRSYFKPNGTIAYLGLATSPEAKRIYRSGAEVPFL